ncbi:hypothetical protein PG996_015897 [Apiospora saccharicola]|uniref:Uncharacterized protein n=1 Tax=Apiospora saccharicola TaxID=335842 RepID=A0ABR1TME2_9PEZI
MRDKEQAKLKNFDCVNGSVSDLPFDTSTETGAMFFVLKNSAFSVSARHAEEGRVVGHVLPDEDETVADGDQGEGRSMQARNVYQDRRAT